MKKISKYILVLILVTVAHQSFSQRYRRSESIFNRNANLPYISMNFNVVGLALYGPIIKAEFKVSNKLMVAPFIRYSYAGAISTYEWTNFESDSKYNPSSIAFGLGPKAFITIVTNKQYIYYGVAGEYCHENGLHNMDEPNFEYKQTRNGIAIYGIMGYRWQTKNRFYFDLGVLPSYVIDLKNEAFFTISEGPVNGIKKKNRFRWMFDIAFGWDLGN